MDGNENKRLKLAKKKVAEKAKKLKISQNFEIIRKKHKRPEVSENGSQQKE